MRIRMEIQPDGYTKKWFVYDERGYLAIATVCENTARGFYSAIKAGNANSSRSTHADTV